MTATSAPAGPEGPAGPGTAAGTSPDVAALLGGLADDPDRGFAPFYDAHRRVLFSTALRVCGNWADAEDLTAETFLRAYRALRGFDRDRIMALRPRSWLLTILLNTWRNGQRTRARRPPEASLDPDADAADPAEGAQQVAERRETRRELADLLLELPEQQRVAVVLRHVSGLPLAEIAAVLGSPEGTVKSHISRALHRLRYLCSLPEANGIRAAAGETTSGQSPAEKSRR